MKKALMILLMMVLSAGIIIGGAFEKEAIASSSKKEPFKIGINFGFTSFMAMAAKEMMQGVEYHFDEIGWEVNGRKIVIVKEDNGSDPAKSLDKAKKLVEIDKIHLMFGPILGASAMAVAGYLKETGTPFIAGLATSKLLKFGGGKNLFIATGTYEHYGDKLGEYLYHELGARTAIAMYEDQESAASIIDGVVRAFEKAGGKLVQTQRFPFMTMDFNPYIINLKKADVLIIWLNPPGVPPLLSQYLNSGKKSRLVIPANGISTEHQLREVGDKTIGILGSELWTPLLETDTTRDFVKGFKKRYGFIPGLGWSGYAPMQIVAAAIEGAGNDISHEAINRSLRKVKVNTLIGDVSFLPSGATIGDMRIMEVVKVNDKRVGWKVVKEYKQVNLGP